MKRISSYFTKGKAVSSSNIVLGQDVQSFKLLRDVGAWGTEGEEVKQQAYACVQKRRRESKFLKILRTCYLDGPCEILNLHLKFVNNLHNINSIACPKDVGSIQNMGALMHSWGTLTCKKGQLCNLERGALYKIC